MNSLKENVTKEVFDFFVKSRDFNGITLSTISERLAIEYVELLLLIKGLVNDNTVSRSFRIIGCDNYCSYFSDSHDSRHPEKG